jgi:integrase/recombinase XerD
MSDERTPAKKKAHELAKYLRLEHPDYNYLKSVFRYLRAELEIQVPTTSTRQLPDVPTEEEIQRYYEAVWHARNVQDMVLIKTLLYTGVRVSELINIRLCDVDFARCQIRINQGKGKKDRIVPFPVHFKEVLAMHVDSMRRSSATYLFESSWKRKYSKLYRK